MSALLLILLGLSAYHHSLACIDCPLVERGKVRYSSIPEEEFLKTVVFANQNLGGKPQPMQNILGYLHGKPVAQRTPPSSSSSGEPLLPPPTKQISASSPNSLFHLYNLLNKWPLYAEPRALLDDYLIMNPVNPRISKKAEKGMMIDVMDYVSKSEDRNRRVGQNMRSSG